MIAVLKSQAGRIENGRFKPVSQITDRAKRYRANAAAPPKHRCFACGNPKVRGVAHIDGNEANTHPRNLDWTCASCNARMANTLRKARIGKKTAQYNPRRRQAASKAAPFGAYFAALDILNGKAPGNVQTAIRTVQSVPPETRHRYGKRLWEIRKERYGPSGRKDGGNYDNEVPF